ncbi:hypothetical protein Q1695_000531 [Nippostrongylus brasiliensis]|nr:hypothetical protein Q1695_000531 [Nippostrongylus brasiliensis]
MVYLEPLSSLHLPYRVVFNVSLTFPRQKHRVLEMNGSGWWQMRALHEILMLTSHRTQIWFVEFGKCVAISFYCFTTTQHLRLCRAHSHA